jgi:hypothetical protein
MGQLSMLDHAVTVAERRTSHKKAHTHPLFDEPIFAKIVKHHGHWSPFWRAAWRSSQA